MRDRECAVQAQAPLGSRVKCSARADEPQVLTVEYPVVKVEGPGLVSDQLLTMY